jgi:hypothetical protein
MDVDYERAVLKETMTCVEKDFNADSIETFDDMVRVNDLLYPLAM